MLHTHKLLILTAVLFSLWLVLALGRRMFRPRLSRDVRAVLAITRDHLEALTKAYRRTAYLDDYGEVNHSKWTKELRYFIKQKFAADVADAKAQKQRVDELFPFISDFFLAHAPDLTA